MLDTTRENRILIDPTLGQYLKKLREQRGYTQHEFAEIMDASQAMVGYIEKGERLPTMGTLFIYASHFSIDIKKLIEVRKITIDNTVIKHRSKTPHHIMNEYYLMAYYTLLKMKDE